MRHAKANSFQRRGAVIVLTAMLLVGLLGIMAMAIDAGWISLAKSDLQNAADSAALAGAQSLSNGYVAYNTPPQTNQNAVSISSQASATSAAITVAGSNAAGGVKSLALSGSDVAFGFTDNQGNYTSLATHGGFPNTVQVTVRRDANANGALNLFFASVFGRKTTNVRAVAAATFYTGKVTSFSTSATCNGAVLPVAFDVNQWKQFLATGTSPDGSIHVGPNGSPQLHVYPSPGNAPGNFGLLCLGQQLSDAGAFRNWIDNGPSPADLQFLASHGEVPVSLTSPQDWFAGPGLKSTLLSNFQNAMNKPRLMPVFRPISTNPYQAADGNGSNANYDVVGFVGVSITQADGSGSNMDISVQPCTVYDPTAVYSDISPAGAVTATNSSSPYLYMAVPLQLLTQ